MMNRTTGRRIGFAEHLQQSVGTILTTPIGSVAMLREFGCLHDAFVDKPANKLTVMRMYAACASALMRWEPRLQTVRLQATRDVDHPGRVVVNVDGLGLSAYGKKMRPVRLSVSIGGNPGGDIGGGA